MVAGAKTRILTTTPLALRLTLQPDLWRAPQVSVGTGRT